jgi:hypothetical protein
MAAKGNAKLTAHVHMVERPEIVQVFREEAERLGVDVSVVYRWALREYAQKITSGRTDQAVGQVT